MCIDDSVTPPTYRPDPIFAAPGVMLNVFTKSAKGTLDLDFGTDRDCVDQKICSKGHCVVVISANLYGGRQCKFDVLLNGQRYDPTVIVQTCCL